MEDLNPVLNNTSNPWSNLYQNKSQRVSPVGKTKTNPQSDELTIPTHNQIVKLYQENKNKQTRGNFKTAIFSYNDHLKMPEAPLMEDDYKPNQSRIQ